MIPLLVVCVMAQSTWLLSVKGISVREPTPSKCSSIKVWLLGRYFDNERQFQVTVNLIIG